MRFPAEFSVDPAQFLAPPRYPSLPEALTARGTGYFLSVATGRSALMKILETVAPGGTGTVWLPSLCCSSLAAPFLERDFRLRFYESTSLWGAPPAAPGDIVLYIHFCGFPNRGAERALAELPAKERPVIIEDCVHALFTDGVGRFGDFALYSFRKFLPVPDGGLLISKHPLTPLLAPPLEPFIAAKTIGRLTGSAELLRHGEELLDNDREAREPSETGRFLLERTEWETIPGVRRRNCLLLGKLLGLDTPLGEGTVPLGLPLLIHRGKSELERLLRVAGFEPPLSWNAPPGAPGEGGDRTVVLPCDERMGEADLAAVAGVARQFPLSPFPLPG